MKNRNTITLFTTIMLVLACFGFSSRAHAVNPPPDGFYPGFNTAEGQNALLSLDTSAGIANTAIGWFSLKSSVDASFNTACGAGTLVLNSGDQNTAIGAAALLLNTIGSSNTAIGAVALLNNAGGDFNTATGTFALRSNTEGNFNTANGFETLFSNVGGSGNTASGVDALFSNINGVNNTASGFDALFSNTEGDENTAIGVEALSSNIDGNRNTANGFQALFSNTSGAFNTANGDSALFSNTNGDDNTAIGHGALFNNFTGSGNIVLGSLSGGNIETANNVICIGHIDGEDVSNTCYIDNIFGVTSPGGLGVFVNSDGKLGTATSSVRFKEEIKPMEYASEVLYALKPVTFRYKKQIDSTCAPQFGLVAEDVEKVNPDLVVRDKEGKPYSVRYEQVNAMLLNEFLKEHRKVQQQDRKMREQDATITRLQKGMETVIARLEAQESQLQKVSAQIEVTKPAPQTVLNNQ